MTVYNGDVNVNPDLLKLGIKRVEELTSVCVNLSNTVKSLTETIRTLQQENKELRTVISEFCLNIKKDSLSDEIFVDSDDKDFRSFKSVFGDKLSVRALNGLTYAGIKVLADFDYLSLQDFKNIRNLGKRTVDYTLSDLASEGIILTDVKKEDYDTSIVAGSQLLMLCDFGGFQKGDIVVVEDYYESKFGVKPFSLTQYPCKKPGNNKTVYLTPSMVKRI